MLGPSPHLARMDMDFEACRRAFLTRDPRFDGRIFSTTEVAEALTEPEPIAPFVNG